MNQTVFSIAPLLGLFMLVACNSSKKVTTIDFHDGSYAGEVDGKGLKQGKGSYKWLDGSYYEGDFDNDLRHGLGHFRWSNGESYKGDYLQDKRTGEGTYIWPDGSTYQGSFLNGKRHGKGIFYAANGAKYNGEWFDDLRHGNGMLIDADGRTSKGIWQNGKLLTKPISLPKPASKPDLSLDTTLIQTQQPTTPRPSQAAYNTAAKNGSTVKQKDVSTSDNTGSIVDPAVTYPSPVNLDTPTESKLKEVNSPQTNELLEEKNLKNNKKQDSAIVADDSGWSGTVEEVEGRFITKLIDGIDTIFDRKTNASYNGKMRILNDSGMISGELHLINGRMDGEELYYENGVVIERNLWKNGKFVKNLQAK
jgi:hypothetical protein